MVERPPKHNGAFHRPLKLMAVYNLRNQQAVTCNTGHERTCVLCVCLIPTYIAKTLLFLAILAFFLPWFSSFPRRVTHTHTHTHTHTRASGPILERSLGLRYFLSTIQGSINRSSSFVVEPSSSTFYSDSRSDERRRNRKSCFSLFFVFFFFFFFTRNDTHLVTVEIQRHIALTVANERNRIFLKGLSFRKLPSFYSR